ncbi:MAG: FkbM family methyltransferase [Aurantimonas endophytica]|uniref:FkbM family methyltransferase n=1 Tax=Aurantimonas endophytica TaxID=1522175 RepID=UPI0030035663
MLISHAQNFEDVILWRALKHVENGFYVDIGAQDPQIDSVSLLFYERGWRGVHVEPTAEYSEKLLAARPDEKVIQAAISSQAGPITFFEIEGTGLSTGAPEIAERHRAKGWSEVETKVPTLRLGELLDRYGNRDIHWLKIDVEGMEQEVIATWSPSQSRPWIVMVESTEPTSEEPTYAAWQDHLEGLGYRFVYFDGLNRFYVSEEHNELMDAFGPGPNIFDDFALSGKGSAPFAEVLKVEIAGARGEIDRLQAVLATASTEIERREAEHQAVLAEAVQHEAEIAHRRKEMDRLEAALAEAALREEKIIAQGRDDVERLQAALVEAAQREVETQTILTDTARRMSEQERLLAQSSETSSLQVAAFHKAASAMERVAEALTLEIAVKAKRIAELESTLAADANRPARLSRLSWFIQGSSAWLQLKPGSRPRRIAGRALRSGVTYLRDRPRAKQTVIRLTGLVPPLQGRLFQFVGAMPEKGVSSLPWMGEGHWYLEPEPAMSAKWAALLTSKKSVR